MDEPYTRWRRLDVPLLVCGVLLFVGLRVVALNADPPASFFHGLNTDELVREPPAKAHEARNFALFGHFQTNPADNYQFWRAQSPVWVYPLAWSFKVFGVSTATLRLTSIAFALLGYVACFAFARRHLGPAAAGAVALFLATQHVLICYGRSGLLEPAVGSFVAAGVVCLAASFREVRFVLLAECLLVLAILTKQAAMPVGLLFAVAGLVAWVRCAGVAPAARRRWRAILAVAVVAVMGALVVYARTPEYQRAIAWNFNHVVRGREVFADAAAVDRTQWLRWSTIAAQARMLWRVYPMLLTLSLVEVCRLLIELARRRRLDVAHALLLGWLACTALGHMVLKYVFVRYSLVFAPVLALLSASLVQAVADRVRSWGPRALGAFAAVVIAGFAGPHLLAWARAVADAKTTVVSSSRALPSMTGPQAVVVGELAGPLCMDNRLEFFYVKLAFNNTRAILDRLAPTHLLVTRRRAGSHDLAVSAIVKADAPLVERAVRKGSLRVRSAVVDVAEIGPPGTVGDAVRWPHHPKQNDTGDDDDGLDPQP